MIKEGIFYCNINDDQVDAYDITYNPDSSTLFDITCLLDSTIYTVDLLLTLFGAMTLINPIEELTVSYGNKENVEWFLQTFRDFYSTISRGISGTDDETHSNLSNNLNKKLGNTV